MSYHDQHPPAVDGFDIRTPHVHDQRFDGDDPRLICRSCGAMWDALSGRPLNEAAGAPARPERPVLAAVPGSLMAAVEALPGACHDGEGLGCRADPCVENVSREAVLELIRERVVPHG